MASNDEEKKDLTRIVMFSGGIGSWGTAKRVAEKYGTKNLILLFADTKIEDEDTYRFLHEAAANVGGELIEIADGRTPWEVFRDHKIIPSYSRRRMDPCSQELKRRLIDKWIKEHFTPDEVVCYVGIDWSEAHRFIRLRDYKKPYVYEAPLCDPPYLWKDDLHSWGEREGLKKQRLYVWGSAHANCGGGCIKMGIGGWVKLLKAMPCRYAEWEQKEKELREFLKKDWTLLNDRDGGGMRPLSLEKLRLRVEKNEPVDLFDIGGCGCFLDVPDEDTITNEEQAKSGSGG